MVIWDIKMLEINLVRSYLLGKMLQISKRS